MTHMVSLCFLLHHLLAFHYYVRLSQVIVLKKLRAESRRHIVMLVANRFEAMQQQYGNPSCALGCLRGAICHFLPARRVVARAGVVALAVGHQLLIWMMWRLGSRASHPNSSLSLENS